jgi:hypothetical protein
MRQKSVSKNAPAEPDAYSTKATTRLKLQFDHHKSDIGEEMDEVLSATH